MDSSVRLFQATTSSASWRIRIALALKAIQYETVWINLQTDEQLGEEYKKVTPTQQVPCLEIDGHLLFQSVAIIEYLEETHPEPPLFPSNPINRFSVRAIIEIINSVIQPMHNKVVRDRLQSQFELSVASTDAWCHYWIENRFQGLNRALETYSGKYSVGDEITSADIFLFPQVEKASGFHVDTGAFPAIERVMENLKKLAPFQNSYPKVE